MKQSVTVLEMRADHVCVCVCVCVDMYICMYVCMYAHFCVYRISSLLSCCYMRQIYWFQSTGICYWFTKLPAGLWISSFPILAFGCPEC
jgi:hypothetical protein